MVEIRRGSDSLGAGERLPWLEPVEDEDGEDYYAAEGTGYGGVIVAAIAVLVGIALVTAGIVWYRHRLAATADIGQIIRAPAEPYKVKPAETPGARTDKNGEVANGTSAGQDIDSPIDLSALPEAPVSRTAPPPAAGPVQSPGQRPIPQAPSGAAPSEVRPAAPILPPPPAPKAVVAPKAAEPQPLAPRNMAEAAPSATGPSATIQLGAFSSQAKADAAWKTMSGRFGFLKPLAKSVGTVDADGKTLYRLRASGPGAAGYCARLRVAGETCSVVGG